MAHLNRTIHLDGQEWKYRIGKVNVLIAEPNSNKRFVIPFRDLAPAKWIAAGGSYHYHHYPPLEITPSDVRDYIGKVIIPDRVSELGG